MRFLNVVLAVTALVFVLSVKPHSAIRVLDGEKEEWTKMRIVPLQSMLSGHAMPPPSAHHSPRPPVVMATEY